MSLFLLFVISLVLLGGGFFVAFAYGMSDNPSDNNGAGAGLAVGACLLGVVGLLASAVWLVAKLL